MAIYHFPTRNVSRSSGRSAVAAAAYRAGIALEDERTGRTHDYSRKVGVVHSEIIAPEHAPAWMRDRQQLWNAAEQAETRKDARTAREFIAALPDELDKFERQTLLRRFVAEQFVAKGMVADINIHHPDRDGDQRNHHAHILLTTRRATKDGFSPKKAREWNSEGQLLEWREAWAAHVNLALERGEQVRGLEPGTFGRVDHRTLEEQGIDREPTIHLGPQATAMERDGIETRLGDHNRDVTARGAELAALKQERAQIDAQIIDLETERTRRRAAELEQEIPYMAPVAAELARAASGQPGDGSPLAQRIDGLAQTAERINPPPSPELVAAWQGMMAAQGHSAERTVSTLFNDAAERLPDPSEIAPRFWELAAEHLAQETARQEQAPAAPARREDGALRDLFNAAAGGTHPVIAQAAEKIETKRSQERHADSQARGLLWLDQAVRGFERVGTRAADMLGNVAGKLADAICDLFSPAPQTRTLSPEEKAERHALETEIEASQERRDARDREQRERLASVMASVEYSRRQEQEQEQSLERTRERTRPGPG